MRRVGLFLVVALMFGAAAVRDGFDRWVATTELPLLVHEISTEVRDRDGDLLRAYTVEDGRWRLAVSLDQVDPRFLEMLIAYEDKRFYRHAGVDPIAMIRAVGQAIWNGRVISGGSTLTMQVARLLEDSGTGRLRGKLRQIRVALKLEREVSKDRILSIYLRIAPYGGNLEGIRAASLAYMGKEPYRLTPAEAALLVALPQAPESRRPDRRPDAAHIARDRVLMRMVTDRVIDRDTALAAVRDPSPRGRLPFPKVAPHLSDRARSAEPSLVQHGLTIDGAMQRALEDLAARVLAGRDPTESIALMVADHQTGEVLASVGSGGYSSEAGRPGFVDMTTAVRSPGSTLKPLVYGLAFDRGLVHPETLISDTPVQFGRYAPQNFDGQFRGELRVSEALQLSLNVPVVRLVDAMGPAHLMAALRATGADPDLPGGQPGLAVALGGVGMTLRDLMAVYTTLARGGDVIPLRWRHSQSTATGKALMGRAAAWQVGHVLAGIRPPAAAGPKGRVAFKTGTSYGHRDAWAIGWDGRYVVGVWMGRPDGTPVPGAFGGSLAAPVMFETFDRVRVRAEPLPPPPPEALLLANAALPPPLRAFRGAANLRNGGPRLELQFPPDGAQLLADAGGVPLRLRHGQAPYTVLANGAVLASGLRGDRFVIPLTELGFSDISVIDSAGKSDSVLIELR